MRVLAPVVAFLLSRRALCLLVPVALIVVIGLAARSSPAMTPRACRHGSILRAPASAVSTPGAIGSSGKPHCS
jgi:hypothetical protein